MGGGGRTEAAVPAVAGGSESGGAEPRSLGVAAAAVLADPLVRLATQLEEAEERMRVAEPRESLALASHVRAAVRPAPLRKLLVADLATLEQRLGCQVPREMVEPEHAVRGVEADVERVEEALNGLQARVAQRGRQGAADSAQRELCAAVRSVAARLRALAAMRLGRLPAVLERDTTEQEAAQAQAAMLRSLTINTRGYVVPAVEATLPDRRSNRSVKRFVSLMAPTGTRGVVQRVLDACFWTPRFRRLERQAKRLACAA